MKGEPVILWFRRDLRVADNAALLASIQSGGPAVPLFIWAPEEESPWEPGSASRWWLHHSLEQLNSSLEKLGSRLVVRRGPSLETLLQVAEEMGAKTIVWNRLYEPALMRRDREIKKTLRERGFTAQSFPGDLLFEPSAVVNSSGEAFRVFTAFYQACLRAPLPSRPLPAPGRILAPSQWPESLPIGDLGLLPEIDWAPGLRESWTPGEAGASTFMRRFAAHSEAYATERDRPDHSGSSRLSPHLHFGELSPRQLWHATGNEAYRRQLLWREFARRLLYHFPHTAEQPLRAEFARFPWRMNEGYFKAWTRGLTGYPLVDAGMRELWHTGWMHNRVRMVVASFLVKHLLIPWQEGARWFWDTLVDADLANNTLGWQWAAGCGADAAPYFRIFNPALQAAKFDPDRAYVRRWIPELGTLAYPSPIVNHAEARARALAAFATLKK